jgi:hypothetical protein
MLPESGASVTSYRFKQSSDAKRLGVYNPELCGILPFRHVTVIANVSVDGCAVTKTSTRSSSFKSTEYISQKPEPSENLSERASGARADPIDPRNAVRIFLCIHYSHNRLRRTLNNSIMPFVISTSLAEAPNQSAGSSSLTFQHLTRLNLTLPYSYSLCMESLPVLADPEGMKKPAHGGLSLVRLSSITERRLSIHGSVGPASLLHPRSLDLSLPQA